MTRRRATAEQVVLSLRKSNGNTTEAAKKLGVTRQAVYKRVKEDPLVRSGLRKYLDMLTRCGATDKRSAQVVADGMIATQTKAIQIIGSNLKEMITEPDHYARLKANDQYLKIKRLIDGPEDNLPTQHLHLHFEDKNTDDLFNEITTQLAQRRNRESGLPPRTVS